MSTQPGAATYGNDPSGTPLDLVRLLVGDTECATAFLTDAEVDVFLASEGDAAYAAVRAAESIAAKLSRKIDIRTGGVSKSQSQAAAAYLKLAKRLQARADEVGGAPVFTALTKDDKLQDREDEGLVQPQFRIGQDDNPRQVFRREVDPKLTVP
jgi:hypothetical protein